MHPVESIRELTATEIHHVEWLLGTIEAKRLVGDPLTPAENTIASALSALVEAEQKARDTFAWFYSNLASGDATAQTALPSEVAATISRWVEARRAWDSAITAYLKTIPPPTPVRTGPRLRASLPDFLRVPTALPARDTLSLLFAPHLWQSDADGTGVVAWRGDTQVRLECDALLGLGPEQAIHQIAKHGASVAQTFFALVGFWMERNPGAPSEIYMTAYASDLLRFQNRKETRHGGYHSEDIRAKGRDLYLLSRISIPSSSVVTVEGGRREIRTLTIGRLLSLESLEMAEDTGSGASIVKFRYHLGREVHEWVGGCQPQYALLSGKLLTYHPVRQKYQILLGFSLAYFDRINRKNGQQERRLTLPALLKLAAIEVPKKRIAEFLTSIEDALADLARDEVIPGLTLEKPEGWPQMLAHRNTRSIIAGSSVVFERLDSVPANRVSSARLP